MAKAKRLENVHQSLGLKQTLKKQLAYLRIEKLNLAQGFNT